MQKIIKKNVVDCILDKKRSVVEVQCTGNVAGREFVDAIKKTVPSNLIKEVRYLFGTTDLEIEMVNSKDAESLYQSINAVMEGKTSNFEWQTFLESTINTVGNTVGGIFNSKYTSQSAQAKAQAEAAAKAAEAQGKNILYIALGAGVLVLIVIAAIIFKNREA